MDTGKVEFGPNVVDFDSSQSIDLGQPRAVGAEVLSHEAFLQWYVLNRAIGHKGGLKASCVEQAELAYQKIRSIVDQR